MRARSEIQNVKKSSDKELKTAKANLYSCYRSARFRCKKIEKAKWEITAYKPQNWSKLTEYSKKKFEEVRQHLLYKLDKEGLPLRQEIQTHYTQRYVKIVISRAMKSDNREQAIARVQGYIPKIEHDQDELNKFKIQYMESFLSISEMEQFKSCLENKQATSEELSIADGEMKQESGIAQKKRKRAEESQASSLSMTTTFSSTRTIISSLSFSSSKQSVVRESISSQDQQQDMQIKYSNFIALIKHFPGIMFSDVSYANDAILKQLKNIYENIYEKKFDSQNVKKRTPLYEGLSSLQIETHELISQLCDSNNRVSFINTTVAQLENLKEILMACSENIKSFAEKADYKIYIDETNKTCSAEYNFSRRHPC